MTRWRSIGWRRIVVGGFALVGTLVTAAWAIDVTFPLRAKARVTVLVNELGQVLFGDTPGRVEVTNFPAGANAATSLVTLADALPVQKWIPECAPPNFVPPFVMIPTAGFTHVSLLGMISGSTSENAYVNASCIFTTEAVAAFYPATAPAVSGSSILPSASVDISGVVLPGGPTNGRWPVLGPFMGCRFYYYDGASGCTEALLTLKAYFSS